MAKYAQEEQMLSVLSIVSFCDFWKRSIVPLIFHTPAR